MLSPVPAEEKLSFLVVLVQPVSLFVAYAGGIIPATCAGLLYGALALVAARLVPGLVVRRQLGLFTGALAGSLVGLVLTLPYLPSLGSQRFLAACVFAGAVSGFLAGWRYPVGRSVGAAAHSAA